MSTPDFARRTVWLSQSDQAILAECEFERFRGSGPGGQKRNKTSNAVRLRHLPSGLWAQANERRSQSENRDLALGRLRSEIMAEVRCPAAPPSEVLLHALTGKLGLGPAWLRSPNSLLIAAEILDALFLDAGKLGETAKRLQSTTSALSEVILADERLHTAVNHLRTKFGLKPIRTE